MYLNKTGESIHRIRTARELAKMVHSGYLRWWGQLVRVSWTCWAWSTKRTKHQYLGDVSKEKALSECSHGEKRSVGVVKKICPPGTSVWKRRTFICMTCSGPYFLHFNHGILSRMDCIFLNLLQKECEEYTVCLHAHSRLAQGASRIFLEINTGFSVPFIQMAVVSEFSALPYFYFFFPRSYLELGFVTITNSCPSLPWSSLLQANKLSKHTC